jgi:16S rRNA (adenine1518-N6/adenine1519-N6)-dimethyltransferase
VRHNPRKRFGQHFLHSTQVISSILQAINPKATDKVLEIGPGLGALTKPLLRVLNDLHAVEIDRDLQDYLTTLPATHGKLHLIAADALQVDYAQWGGDLRVVGNLPYNISTPLIMHLLTFSHCIKDMYFMLQKEVVDRMAATPGSKDYGRLSVMLQYLCEVENLFTVPPEAFDPPPRVDSAVVRLTPHQSSPFDAVPAENLQALVAKAFSMRRKTLTNNLKGVFSVSELNELGIDGSMRPEQIAVADYVKLAQFVAH